MRILFISGELIGSSVIHKLIKEGHEVKLYIEHKDRKDCFDGFVEKVDNWKKELNWVGKEGLIIFDDVIFEGAQDSLREQGYSVFGGNLIGDHLELDRQLFQEKLKEFGLPVLQSYEFKNADDAINFVEKNREMWVLKQNSHIGMLNHVGLRDDAEDVLDLLKLYKKKKISPIHLQKKVTGVEMGVGRHFNGEKWVGPIKINFEHKPLCHGNIGPLTAEMGTLVWLEDDDNTPIFKNTLAKTENYLKEINYKGDIDINCIVNEDGIWPLEATMRFGTPSTELHIELYETKWGKMLKAIADGKDYKPKFSKEYGIVVSIAVPPFPYAPEVFEDTKIENYKGTSIYFSEDLSEQEMDRIHFEEISVDTDKHGKKRYYLAGKHGYALYVTGRGKTVKEAQKNTYDLINKIMIPKMFYRTDIGDKFIYEEEEKLRKWGWI